MPFPAVLQVETFESAHSTRAQQDVLLTPNGLLDPSDVRELQDVLYAGPRHAAVCPRMPNTGRGSSFPAPGVRWSGGDDETLIRATHARMAPRLPRFTLISEVEAPILIRGDLIRRYGVYTEGRLDLSRTAHRWARYGYSAVSANRILCRRDLRLQNSRRGADPQPQRPFIHLHPLERFADCFRDESGKHARLLFYYRQLRAGYNGTAEYSLRILRELVLRQRDTFDITVFTSPDAARFHRLHDLPIRLVHDEATLGVFDLGFIPCHVLEYRDLSILHRHCLRMTFTVLDLIWFRCEPIRARDPQAAARFRSALEMADGVLTISQSTENDLRSFCPERFAHNDERLRSILLAPLYPDAAPASPVCDEGPVLMFGNSYVHKAIPEALHALSDLSRPVILVGGSVPSDTGRPSVSAKRSGHLTPEAVQQLFQQCSVLVFPSQYEGFGFPVAQALAMGKPVVLFADSVNHEVGDAFSVYEGQVQYCETFDDLRPAVERAIRLAQEHRSTASAGCGRRRDWSDVAGETADFFNQILGVNVCAEVLGRRAQIADLMAEYCNCMDILRVPIWSRIRRRLKDALIAGLHPRPTPAGR